MKAKSRRQFTSAFKVKVVLEVLRQDKTLNQIASEYDLHPQVVQTWKQAFMTAAPQVFDQQKGGEKLVADETGPLYEQIERLQMELTWLKKKMGHQPLIQRRAMIERANTTLSLRRQCWLLSVSRAGLAYQPVAPGELTLLLMHRLDEWYVDHPELGHRQLVVLFQQEGWAVNIKRIRRLRAVMGLETQFPRPNLSRPGVPRQRFFYLLRGLVIDRVHQVWATDITYVPMPKGFFYVMAILDLHSRYVLHWQLSNTLEADWCVETLQQSLLQWGKPQIFNTDQGSQFTSDDFVGVLQEHQIAISWDGKGRALDNIFTVRRCGRTLLTNVEIRRYLPAKLSNRW